jgi:hypothetical protein
MNWVEHAAGIKAISWADLGWAAAIEAPKEQRAAA